jgi:hypothetical protein
MSVILRSSSPFTAEQTVAYLATGGYTGSIVFDLFTDAVSGVSSVEITAFTVGFSATVPSVSFAISGADTTLPITLISHPEITETDTLYYTVSVNNNYTHASTIYAQITSNLTAIPQVSADCVAVFDTYENSSIVTSGDAPVVALGDAGAPTGVTGLTVTAGTNQLTLNWTPSVSVDNAGSRVVQNTTAIPTTSADGTTVYVGTGATVALTGLNSNVNYYFGVFSFDNVFKYSTLAAGATAVDHPTYHGYASQKEHARLYVEGII